MSRARIEHELSARIESGAQRILGYDLFRFETPEQTSQRQILHARFGLIAAGAKRFFAPLFSLRMIRGPVPFDDDGPRAWRKKSRVGEQLVFSPFDINLKCVPSQNSYQTPRSVARSTSRRNPVPDDEIETQRRGKAAARRWAAAAASSERGGREGKELVGDIGGAGAHELSRVVRGVQLHHERGDARAGMRPEELRVVATKRSAK